MPRNNEKRNKEQKAKDWQSATNRGQRWDSSRPGSTRAARQQQRRLSVRGERREQPDLGRVARAMIAMALAEAEREAQAQQEAQEASTEQSTDQQHEPITPEVSE